MIKINNLIAIITNTQHISRVLFRGINSCILTPLENIICTYVAFQWLKVAVSKSWSFNFASVSLNESLIRFRIPIAIQYMHNLNVRMYNYIYTHMDN